VTDSTPVIDPADLPRPWYARPTLWALAALALAAALMLGTCRQDLVTRRHDVSGGVSEANSDDLFENAVHQLNQLQRYQSDDVLTQIVERFNQWLSLQPPNADWKATSLLDGLPDDVARFSGVRSSPFLRMVPADRIYLRDSVWLRDISNYTRGDDIDALSRATRLFDWTVRNIQLEETSDDSILPFPGKILLHGRGSVADRTWIFLLLCRQQGIDAALLALGDPSNPEAQTLWIPSVLIAGQLYLFESGLGMPVPGPGGVGIATLEQAAGDPSVLRQLDLDNMPYPFSYADVQRVVALIAAEPGSVSHRMERIEGRLTGADRIVLAVNATALAGRLRSNPRVVGARLWERPFAAAAFRAQLERSGDQQLLALANRGDAPFGVSTALMAGRMYHFKGIFAADPDDQEERSAVRLYQLARTPPDEIMPRAVEIVREGLAHQRIDERRAEQLAPRMLEHVQGALTSARKSATYWLGVVTFERGDYATAIDYFLNRTLEADPDGPWSDGAAYNLARCYEATGDYARAIEYYRQDASPQRHGSLLRARRLLSEHPQATVAPPDANLAPPQEEQPAAAGPPADGPPDAPPSKSPDPAAESPGAD
jgi:tetratricopeptide (TPR) repeat protein